MQPKGRAMIRKSMGGRVKERGTSKRQKLANTCLRDRKDGALKKLFGKDF